jgi:uncharacterized membrane protein
MPQGVREFSFHHVSSMVSTFFESVRVKEKEPAFSYGPIFKSYFSRQWPPAVSNKASTFVPYAGSEGYSPVAYLPQAAAALIARVLDLEFLPTLYLMRFAGLAALTALIAYAIAIVPNLSWAFLSIAMLPAAIYGRSVISADGSALAGAMVVIASWVRIGISQQPQKSNWHPFWVTLSALTKPPNVVFVFLFPLHRMRMPHWQLFVLTAVPAISLTTIWTLSSGADAASWRMVEITGQNLGAFDPSTKLVLLAKHPMHFIAAVRRTWHDADFGELWLQVIGVLGLFDVVLRSWVYPTLTVLLFSTFLARLPVDLAARWRIAFLSSVSILAYLAAVYLIGYLVFTPAGEASVWGIQGRYFVPILPLMALCVATLLNRAPPKAIIGALAISAAMLSGGACVEAILRSDWKLLLPV